MALKGAKLICLDADDNGEFETIVPKGKSFKFGYYMDCDVVLQHPDAMGLQCVIDCDAFGRVTIENLCTDKPITLDGKALGRMRPLLHNTEICILDKKYLWQFEGNSESRGFQMEDVNDLTTPSKQIKKAQQPPNSEPARKWRRQFQNRLTIHSFAYCIKAGESPQDVKTTTDENKPLNIHDRTTDAEIVQNKILSPPQATVSDFVDSNTLKSNHTPLGVRNSPLSYCNLTETVITSYSPRETGIRQEKSFAVVQSPQATSEMRKADVSLGPFHHPVSSPQALQIHRPSMHLIDLTTPMKLMPSSSSPARTLLKSTLKKNLPQGISPRTPQKPRKTRELSTTGSSETVYSVRSTDDESVIVVSDDASTSPSPIAKTPPRGRTPQSLMKRAILSSAKKAAVAKKLLNLSGPKRTVLPATPKNPNTVRFQSQSTPQRKSTGRIPSSVESLSAGKPRKSLITSTPFRRAADTSSSFSRRSLTINSQSASMGSAKHESRNSLMLRQALSMTPTSTISNQKRKSVSSVQISHKPRKSVSFLENVEKEDPQNVEAAEAGQELNRTFSIEEDEKKDIECDQVISSNRKDETISTEKKKCQEGDPSARESFRQNNEVQESFQHNKEPDSSKASNNEVSFQNKDDSVVLHESKNVGSKNQTPLKKDSEIRNSSMEITSTNPNQKDTELHDEITANKTIDPQTPQSSRIRLENIESISNTSEKHSPNTDEDNDYEFDGLDEIFKTPKAKNLMILSSPKSISLQKRSSDSVELIHPTDFDLSANLDDLFQTPQSEFIINRVDTEATPVTSASCAALSPEEAFDMLIGRPSIKKSYTRKTPPKKQEISPLKMSSDPSFPKTDIEEWIDSVNESIEHLESCQNEDEMSYLNSAMNEYSRDPLMMSSVAESSTKTTTTKVIKTPKDEFEMTLQEVEEEDNNANATVRKDPLEMTVPRSLSPNISGINLLDHTSESIFSETLAVSDDSSLKETEKTAKVADVDNYEEITTPGNKNLVGEAQEDKARREIEEAFKNFEMERKTLEEKRLVSTPEAKKPSISKLAVRRTMGNQVVTEVKLDLQAAKAERELELAFENFKEEPEYSVKRVVKTPEPTKTSLKDHRRTLGSALVQEVKLDLQAAKAERELELAFENFEEEPQFSANRAVTTPQPKKTSLKDHRRTLGSALEPEVKLDLQAAKAERELGLAFENFEEEPEFTEKRLVKTPETKKVSLKDHRRTLGSALVTEVKLNLQAAKAERELELAFENFEEEPQFLANRVVTTPEPKKTSLKDHRITLGSALVPGVKLDLQAAKAERDLELAFENFEEEPEFTEERLAKTPEPKKTSLKEHRRTLGSALLPEVKLDLQAAKAERELELAFENFEEEPEFSANRVVQTPEPKKSSLKDHRRTLGTALVPKVKFDLQAAKTEREMELAFENFEEEPELAEERLVKTPDPQKTSLKDHRRSLGSALVQEVKLDLQAAKAERDLELAFENFEDEPQFTEERLAKTPEPKKVFLKDHRRTLGSALVSEVKLDLQAAKAERDLELAFENFEEEPEFAEERLVKTPELKKTSLKDHRRTLGSALVQEVKLDLQAAKAERDLELAFENFEDEPQFTEERLAKTPEPKKVFLKDHRRTLGSALVSEVKLDLQAAKAERDLELAFENFEEEPEFAEERLVKTPELKKTSLKDHRRTLGSALVQEVKLDLQAAKAERELELAFENFEEEPEFSANRVAKTPEPKKTSLKDHRRTLGSAMVPEVKLDLQAAKAERELELAFENFEEEPEYSKKRLVKTPEPKKVFLKDHRRTLGSALVPEVKLDLQAAKAERELELAFENFEEEPEFAEDRLVKTPEPKKTSLKDHRRTLGSALVPEVKLDLKAAKAERDLELAFENFEEEPEFAENRLVKTPEPMKKSLKDHRRTLGSALVPEVKLDLQAAKVERDLELAFENFKEEPEFAEERLVKTPEPKKASLKDHRRTLGSALVPEVKLDLQAAKAERELELAFENFVEEPEFAEERLAKTPEPKKTSLKDHRRTLGSALVQEVKLDLQAAKAERELELAFENFEEEPEFAENRLVKTPEPMKKSLKDHRRTLGSALVPEVKLDLQAAKAERDLELAFENFEEEPEFSEERLAKTPEPEKTSRKDHRRTLGSALVQEVKLDLQTAKAERELELAFENFEEEPEFSANRVVKTPERKKSSLKDHRRTLGTDLVPKVKFDLQAAKTEREIELAFENFEEEPELAEQRLVKTPEPEKTLLKDHRRSLGSALVQEVKIDLQAAKAERELELAFENFEEVPEFSEERLIKTPEPKKASLKDHRRTLGSALVPEVKLDLQAAKAERELELAFENFEEEPEFAEERLVKTPEPKKVFLKDNRRTLGSTLVSEVKLDFKAAKAEREMEKEFENFEEKSNFSEIRVVRTPEPKKATYKEHRRTLGSALVTEVTLDLQAAKAEREKSLISTHNEIELTEVEKQTATIDQERNLQKEFESKNENTIAESEYQTDLIGLALEVVSNQKDDAAEKTEGNKTTALRKTRKNTVEEGDEPKTMATENLTRTRKTRQHSVDAATDNAEKQSLPSRKTRKTSNSDDEAIKITTSRLDSTDVDSTEDETNQSSNKHRKKRILKKGSKTSEASLKETEVPCLLEPIVEEERNPDANITNNEVETKSSSSHEAESVEIKRSSPVASKNLTQMRRTRQNSIDTPTHDKKPNLPKMRKTRQNSVDIPADDSKTQAPSSRKTSSIEDEAINIISLTLDSEDEINQISMNPPKKLIRNKTSETSLKELETQPEPQSKSVLSLKSEADEIITLSPITSQNSRQIRKTRKKSVDTAADDSKKSGLLSRATINDDESLKVTALRRTRQNSVDTTTDDSQKAANLYKTSNNEDEAMMIPLLLRPRQNSVDTTTDDSQKAANLYKTSNSEDEAMKTPLLRRTRQNSVDTSTDDATTKVDTPSRKVIKVSKNEEVDEENKITTSRLDSTDNYSTEDEANKTSMNPRNKRLRKKASKVGESSLKAEVHCVLEPIVEEEKNIETKIKNEELVTKSVITLKAEADEIVSLSPVASHSRIRGRRAQLNVVLLESKNTSSVATEKQCVNPVADSVDDCSNKEYGHQSDIENDAGESIPATPVPLNSRGRRPSKTLESSKLTVSVLTNTRRGSAQQDDRAEVEQNQTEEIVSPSSKETKSSVQVEENDTCEDTSKTPEDTTSKQMGNAQTHQDDTHDNVEYATLVKAPPPDITEDVISQEIEHEPDSPPGEKNNIPSKARGRRAAVKSETLSESTVPVRSRGRKRAAEKVFETQPQQEGESHKEAVDDAKPTNAESKNISLQSSTDQEENVKNPADVEQQSTTVPPQKRGRKAAVKTDTPAPASLIATPVRKSGVVEMAYSSMDKLDSSTVVNKNEENDDLIVVSDNASSEATKACEESVKSQPQHAQDDEPAAPELKIISLLDSTNQEENVKSSSDVEEISTPVPLKRRGRKAAVKTESAANAPLIATPVRRGGRRKAVELPTSNAHKLDSAIDNENEDNCALSVALHKAIGEVPRISSKPCQKVVETQLQQVTESQKEESQDVNPKLKTISQLDSANQKDNDKSTSDVEEISTPVPTKQLGRRAVTKIEPTASAPLTATPVRRAGRKKADEIPTLNAQNRVDSPTDNENEHKVHLTSQPDLVIVSSTPIGRGATETDVEETIVSASVLPKTRGRRAGQKVQAVERTENSALAQKQVHRDAIELTANKNASIIESVLVKSEPLSAEKKVVSKKRTHKALVKQETESINESSAKEEKLSSTNEVDTTQEYSPMTKRNRRAPAKLTEFIVFNLVKSPNVQTPTGYKKHGQTATPKVEKVESTQESLTPVRKRGRPAKTNLEKMESTPECSTPIPKRGRKGFVEHEHHEESAPFRRGVRLGKPKEEAVEISIEDQQQDQEMSEKVSFNIPKAKLEANSPQNTSVQLKPELISEKKESEEKPEKKPTRRIRGLTAASPSLPVSEDQSAKVEARTLNKPTRGRGKAFPKNDSTLESSQRTEEAQPAAEEESQRKPTRRGKVVSAASPSQPVSEEQPTQVKGRAQIKPSRGRGKAVTKNDSVLDSSQRTEEAQPAAEEESQNIGADRDLSAASLSLPVSEEHPTQVKGRIQNKPSRGRGKAVTKIDSTLESSQRKEEVQPAAAEKEPVADKESQKKPTRRGRAVSAASPSLLVPEEQATQVKPSRGRGKAVTKNDSTLESSQRTEKTQPAAEEIQSTTEETQPAAEEEFQNTLSGKGLSATSPSLKVSKEQPTEVPAIPQNKPTRGRGKAVPKNDSTLESSQRTEEAQPAIEEKLQKQPARRGRALSATSPSLPVSEEQQTQVEERRQNKPTRGRGKAVPKTETTLELSPRAEEPQPAVNEESQKKPTRRGRAILAASPSLPASEEQPAQFEVKTQNKPTRGRGKALTENDSTQESIPQSEESQPAAATKPKSNRGRKAVLKSETSPEKEAIQAKPSASQQISNTTLETSLNEDEEKVDKKPKRGRKLATADTLIKSPEATEPSPVTKKPTRGRKAASSNVAKESDDQLEIRAQKLPRSGKVQDKDTKPASKRQILDVQTKDDQQDTPSKRIRRKPIKLL